MSGRTQILRFPDADTLADAALKQIVAIGSEAIRARGELTLSLSGGKTPIGLYQRLAQVKRRKLDWSKVKIFFSDERCVAPDHPDSNYRTARETLLDHVPIPPGNIFMIDAEILRPVLAARRYEEVLGKEFGETPGERPPALDIILLGLGEDGHTASLFAGSKAILHRSRWVVASRAPIEPKSRVTMTLPILNRARRIMFLVTGQAKAPIVAKVLEGKKKPDHKLIPAVSIRPEPGELLWLLDEAAASELKTKA